MSAFEMPILCVILVKWSTVLSGGVQLLVCLKPQHRNSPLSVSPVASSSFWLIRAFIAVLLQGVCCCWRSWV